MPAASDPIVPSRRRVAAALLTGILWLVVVAVLAVVATRVLAARDLQPADMVQLAGSLVLQIAAPLAVVLVALELVGRGGRDDAAQIAELEARHLEAATATTAIRDGLIDVDATLAAISSRVDGLRTAAASEGGGLVEVAGRLEAAAGALREASHSADASAHALDTALPASRDQVVAIGTALAATGTEAGRQLDAIETMLAGIWARNAEAATQAETATTTMTRLLGEIDDAATRAAAGIADRTAALGGTVDAALDRTTAALDATRDGVHVQTNALLASVDQARVALDQIGGEAARAIGKRLERVLQAAEQLGAQLDAADTRSRAMVETAERSFTVLDARVGHAASMSHATLDGIAAKMTAVREQVATIHAPLGDTGAALREIEDGTARLAVEAERVTSTLARELPGHHDAVAGLSSGVADLADATARLSGPVGTSEDSVGRLAILLETAHVALGAIEAQANGTALAASNQLIEVLGRVREVANATAGQMRDTLAGVIAEAEAALDGAGSARAEAAFGEPLRRELAAVEEASARAGSAAQTAAERVSQRLLGLTRTVATVEARIDEVDTRYEIRLRDDLARRSGALLDSLRDNAIDIAKLLAIDVSDTDWLAYLKGDRSLFARRAVRLIDGGTARAIARHFKHDPEFAEQATRYIDEFEQLLARVKPDRDGKALAVTLVSSDIGKLYVALEQGIERLR